ncbi:selT-like protein [Citrus clementina]|uniref:selT-like protein n=1 Tax=Citrus clementina TaxID=85681 RepID=UPI000CED4E9E|nr:selT-like protein [Citrus x clementina]
MLFIFIYIYVFVCAYILYKKFVNVSEFDDEMQKPSSSIASGIGVGHVISISFCTSYSYRGHAMTTKRMLEEAFPGITVTLANHPPPLIKRLMGIVIPILQGGVIVIIMGGEQIFQKLGYMKPPPWYYSLRANRHGTIITTWFLGNYIKSCLKNSGAFEVFSDGELVKFLLWKIHSSFLFFVSEL